jgi:pectinesterase
MDKHIKGEGWHNWNKPDAERTTFYAEYGSRGPGAKITERVNWAHQLSGTDVNRYTHQNIFGDWKVTGQ